MDDDEGWHASSTGSRTPSSAASSSATDSARRAHRRKSLELLNRNEAEIINEAEMMSHDFHYAEYLDLKQPSSPINTAAAAGSRSSLHSSKSSSFHGSITSNARKDTPSGGGYASTDDSAISYHRAPPVARSGSGGDSKRGAFPHHHSSYTSATKSHRRQSQPSPTNGYGSDPSGLGDVHRPPSSDASADTPPEEDMDGAVYEHGSGAVKSTKKERKRLSDHTTVPPLELGNSCFEEGSLKGGSGETSSDDTGAGPGYYGAGKFARRFSGHSMASINLIMPRMDDSGPDADVGELKHDDSGRRNKKKRSSRGSKDSKGSSKTPPPDDLNPRWQGSMTDEIHANASGTSTSRMRKSRSISPHRRHAIENFNRSGNASTNFVAATDATSRWSDSDGSNPGADAKSRVSSSLSGSEGQATKKATRFRRGGLKGIWSIVVKHNESSRDRPKESFFHTRNKSIGRRRDYGIDSSENTTTSSSGPSRGLEGRRSRKVKHKSSSDVETGRGVDITDTGSLAGQGNLGDKMVIAGSKGNPKHTPPNKRRRIIIQCCMAVVLLILAFVLPLILKVPGLVPPRTAEVLEAKAKELFDRISSAASSPFVSSGEQ